MRHMKSSCTLAALVLSVLVTPWLQSQTTSPQHIGQVQDWTQHHSVFTQDYSPRVAAAVQSDARVYMWMLKRAHHQAASAPNSQRSAVSDWREIFLPPRRPLPPRNPDHIDWSVSLGAGNVPVNMYPAKYGFDINGAPSCANDFVVYGLNVAGVTGGQANLVALNYLYSGTTPASGICNNLVGNGSNPATMFAYNIGAGQVLTSPTLSLDGAKIAFVESTATGCVFHVLTWQSNQVRSTNGSILAAAVPGTNNGASMTSLAVCSGTDRDTNSSPYVDYTNDVAYVGTTTGKLYKITGVFRGTPALAGSPWPVTVSSGAILTGPVLDTVTGRIFVGDSNGVLKAVNSTTGTTVATLQVGALGAQGGGIADPPIVDSSNGTVFAFSANDGTGAVAVQANTNLTSLARARTGLGDVGAIASNVVSLHSGTLTDAYFTSPASGALVVCGTNTADTTPSLWVFGFNGTTLNTTAQYANYEFMGTAAGTECSPLTVINNPAIGSDVLFFSVPKNCSGGGCIYSLQVSGTTHVVAESGGTSGIVVDNVSTASQASSIYFTTRGTTKNAVKLTQAALQ